MIIFGSRTSKGKTRRSNIQCPYCNVTGELVFQPRIKYLHLFWIPIFPIFKTSVAKCNHCQKVYPNNVTREMTLFSNSVKKEHKISVFHFTGLIIFAIVLIIGLLPKTEKQKQKLKEQNDTIKQEFIQRLESPNINDIYYLDAGITKMSDGDYLKSILFVVVNITPDSVYFKGSKFSKLDKKIKGGYAVCPLNGDPTLPENLFQDVYAESRDKLFRNQRLLNYKIRNIDRK